MQRQKNQLEIDTENSKPIEKYLHESLRPICKNINHTLLIIFESSILEFESKYKIIETKLKLLKAENFISKNLNFKNISLGMVLSQMNIEEIDFYVQNKKELNKRIHELIKQRILSQIN